MNTLSSNRTFHQLAALSGVAGPIVFILIVIIAGTLYDGYSHLSQAVSELGAVDSPVQALQTFNFFIIGTTLAIFALSFHRRFPGSSRLTTGLLLGFAFSAGIGNGIFPCAPGCDMVSTTGVLHNLTGLAGFTALAVGLLLIARRLRGQRGWSRWASYTQITGSLIIVFFVLWGVTVSRELLPNLRGLFQRLMILSFLQWYAVMGIYLLRQPVHVFRAERSPDSHQAA